MMSRPADPPGGIVALPRLAAVAALPILLVMQVAQAAPPAAAAATPTTSGAPAADAGEQIVVTARHRAERAQTVPIAISTVGKKKLRDNAITSLDQLEILVPTLQITQTNARNTSFNIRGIGNNVSVASNGLESGVGVYVDGVFYSRPGQATLALPDLDNVQVLRGPQGTLFGKNTTAGAVDIHTSLPSFTPSAELESSIGNDGYWQLRGTATGGIGDKVAASLSFVGDQRNGDISSIGAGRHYDNRDDKSVRLQVLAMPTDNLTLRLILDYAHQHENCCIGLPTGIFTSLQNGTPIANNILQREAFLKSYIPDFNAFDRNTPTSQPTTYDMEAGGASLQADYSLGGFTLTSISAWRFFNWNPYNGSVGVIGPNIFNDIDQTDYQKQASQEFRITSPAGHAVDYTAGAYFFYQDIPGINRTDYGPAAGPFILGPSLPAATSRLALNGVNVYDTSDAITASYATYGQATWHVLPRFDLTGGLRYTYEDKSGSFEQSQFGGASLSGLPTPLATALQTIRTSLGGPIDYDLQSHNGAVSWLTNASYRITPDMFAYATYSRGQKSGGINVTSLPIASNGTLLVNPIVKPERVDNYEVGLKTSWLHDRLTANIAAFWLEDSDYQGLTLSPLSTGAYATYISNVPKVRSRGFELDTQAHPFPSLTLNFSAAFTDAIYESYPAGPCPPEVVGGAVAACDLTGKPVPGTSRWAMSVGGEYHHRVGQFGRYAVDGYFGGDFALKSAFNVSATDSIYSQIPGYGVLNVRAGVRTEDGRYDVFVWSHNATNTDYYKILGTASPFSGLVDGIPGDPVMFGMTVRARI